MLANTMFPFHNSMYVISGINLISFGIWRANATGAKSGNARNGCVEMHSQYSHYKAKLKRF